jgi:hypothetical protein
MRDEYNRSELQDLQSAYMLLAGDFVRDQKGLPTRSYLKGNSEIEARRALARLLRSQKPLDSSLRQMLASLFDPRPSDTDQILETNPIERSISFKKRGRGRGVEPMRHLAIADMVFSRQYGQPRRKATDVISELANELDISEETIKFAVRRFRDRFNPIKAAIKTKQEEADPSRIGTEQEAAPRPKVVVNYTVWLRSGQPANVVQIQPSTI